MTARLLVIFAVCLVAGCAGSQGLNPEALHERLRIGEQRFVGEQSQKPIATPPSGQASGRTVPKFGLYLNPTGFLQREFEWADKDRDAVLAWAKGVSAKGLVADASFIPLSSIKGNSLTELRVSAARYGADLLLVVEGAASVDRYNNYKAWLSYWTILGAYFADGTQSDALCLVRGSLWDVATGTTLSTDEAQGTARQTGPAVRVEDTVTVSRARQQALTELFDAVTRRLPRSQ